VKGSGHIILSAFCIGALTAGAAAASLVTARSASASEARARMTAAPARLKPWIDLSDKALLGDKTKLAALGSNLGLCKLALGASGVSFTELAPEHEKNGCGYDEAIAVDASLSVSRTGDVMPMACALAARIELWKTTVVEPAALKAFGAPLVEIEAFGAYSCRRVNGDGPLSKHAFAKAADISAFKLADGRMITVLDSYHGETREAAFLRDIHDKACSIFDVTLGPDYNDDHANHFHLDVGGDSACR
jgi:hypothetical protein